MSSQAVQVLSDLNPEPKEKKTFKTAATMLALDKAASKLRPNSGNMRPHSGKRSPNRPDSGRSGLLQPIKETHPNSSLRPRSGVKSRASKKSVFEIPAVPVNENTNIPKTETTVVEVWKPKLIPIIRLGSKPYQNQTPDLCHQICPNIFF